MSSANVTEVLKERGARYGNFMSHSKLACALQDIVRGTPGWQMMEADQKHSLDVIFDKVARMCNGDPDYPDNWLDIEGYARLVRVRLEESDPLRAEPVQASSALLSEEPPKFLALEKPDVGSQP